MGKQRPHFTDIDLLAGYNHDGIVDNMVPQIDGFAAITPFYLIDL